MTKKNRVNVGSLIFDLLIDIALIGMGAALYYVFMVRPIGPAVGINDMFVELVGSKLVAVLIISGLPFIIGLWSLVRTLARTAKKLRTPPPDSARPAA
ncbi:MAG: hypothetical protein AB1750_02890 [Chloroflexota bacterium]